MYNFIFIMECNPWVYQQQLNRVSTPQEHHLCNERQGKQDKLRQGKARQGKESQGEQRKGKKMKVRK
jgi:hypothetical protein